MPASAELSNITRWLLPAVLVALVAASAATAQDIQQPTGSVNTQSTWTPPFVSRPTRPGTNTNCQSLGSGCTSCSYRTTRGRGLLAEDPAVAAAAATASPTGTVTAAATRGNRRRGSSSGGISYGGTTGGGGTINPWVETSSGGYYSSSSGGSSGGGSGSGGSWTCNTCSAAGSYKLTRVNGVGTCGGYYASLCNTLLI